MPRLSRAPISRPELRGLPLLKFIPGLSPEIDGVPTDSPEHLQPLPDLLAKAPGGNLRVVSDTATRHGKTTLLKHAIVWWLIANPKLDIMYLSNVVDFAHRQNREMMELFRSAGGELSDTHATMKEWRTSAGGGVYAASTEQPIIGRGAHVIVIDDPFEGPEDADNPARRKIIDERITFATTRLHPGGSIFLVMSPFHPDDASQKRRHDPRWLHVHLAAIHGHCAKPPSCIPGGCICTCVDCRLDGKPLWPQVRPLEWLEEVRAELRKDDPTERIWFAQYMGEPRNPEADYFGEPARYEHEPPNWSGFRDVMGIDMSFTSGRPNDWFAIIVARVLLGKFYIRNAYRFKADPREVPAIIKSTWAQYGKMPIFSYMSGPERGSLSILAGHGIAVEAMQPRVNKLWRAQRTIALWKQGSIVVPKLGSWVDGFIGRAKAFRGVEGDDDDEVDAMVSLVDAMLGAAGPGEPTACGPRRM